MNEQVKAIIDVSGKDFAGSIPAAGATVDVPAETGPGTPNKEMRRLRDNALDGFRNGACLDLRVRFAMELLTHSPIFVNFLSENPQRVESKLASEIALDIASDLFRLAEDRGLIEPFAPMDDFLRGHIERQVAYQLAITKEQAKQQDQSIRVAGAVHSAINRPN